MTVSTDQIIFATFLIWVACLVGWCTFKLLEWRRDVRMYKRVEDHATKRWLEKQRKKESNDGQHL